MTGTPTIDEVIAADEANTPSLPAMPDVDVAKSDLASVEYAQHRTKLSTHRTALSTQRTGMSSRRTGMSFQRTRMSADRTLMSVIRTALSLISFGFTIYQFFQHLQGKTLLQGGVHPARNFGAALVYLGVGMLMVGIGYHISFMRELRRERGEMTSDRLINAATHFPISMTLIVAGLLLLIGLAAIASLTFHIGPLQ
jgi:uncharacterized membrane protein YidH (DUF202 family)